MIKQFIFCCIVFTCSTLAMAQPGGGGGLYIMGLYNERGQQLNAREVSITLLTLDSVMNIISKRELTSAEKKEIYLRPLNAYSYSENRNTGLLIQYKHKNYRVDFENILPQNGAGYREAIDSLVLFKPYILHKRRFYHPDNNPNIYMHFNYIMKAARDQLHYGITKSTYPVLARLGLCAATPAFAYNRQPLPWMQPFSEIVEKFLHTYYKDKLAKYQQQLKTLRQLQNDYGNNEAFDLMEGILKKNIEKEKIKTDK